MTLIADMCCQVKTFTGTARVANRVRRKKTPSHQSQKQRTQHLDPKKLRIALTSRANSGKKNRETCSRGPAGSIERERGEKKEKRFRAGSGILEHTFPRTNHEHQAYQPAGKGKKEGTEVVDRIGQKKRRGGSPSA